MNSYDRQNLDLTRDLLSYGADATTGVTHTPAVPCVTNVNLRGYQNRIVPAATTSNVTIPRKSVDNIVKETSLLHVDEELRRYEQYLDDYNYCRKERLKRNAMDKYNIIMQSVKNKSTDVCTNELDESETRRDKMIYDIERSPAASSASSETKLSHDFLTCYKKILRRHGRRLTSGNQYA